MSYQPSDIVLLPFPFSDLSALKRRPVLIVAAPDARGDFLAVQITSQPQTAPALRLQDSDFLLGTLPKASWVRVDKLFTLNAALIVHRAGQLQPAAFATIQKSICHSLGCGA